MKLEKLCSVFTDGDWIESKDQSPYGIRLIQTGNIGEGAFLDKEERAKYISEGTFEELKCTEIFPGDILISRLPDPVGRACIVPDKEERMITAVDCSICRVKNDLIDTRYLCYYLQSNQYYKQLDQNVTGTAREKRISRKNLGNVEVTVPALDKQYEVVQILDKVSSAILDKKKQLELFDELIKSRFVELFGDRYTNDKNWENKPLYECADFYNGKAHEQVVDENGEYILVTSRCIASDITDYRRTNALLFPLKTNDIAMVMSDVPNGRALAKCILIDEDNKYTLNQRICCLRNYSFNPIFFYYLLNRHEYFLSFNDGNAQTNLRKDDLLACNVIIPPIELQNQFAAFVEQTDKSKVAIQKSIDAMQALYDKLIQEYFG